MAMNANSKTILEFLKANNGKDMTSAQVAEALGMDKKSVDGAFTAFTRKDLGIRVEDTVEGDVEVKVLSITDAGKAAAEAGKVEDKELSANAKTVLNYLADGKEVTLEELAEAIDLDKKVVNGTFNGLVRKELCERTIKTGRGPVPVKYLRLTDAGLAYDPDQNEEA